MKGGIELYEEKDGLGKRIILLIAAGPGAVAIIGNGASSGSGSGSGNCTGSHQRGATRHLQGTIPIRHVSGRTQTRRGLRSEQLAERTVEPVGQPVAQPENEQRPKCATLCDTNCVDSYSSTAVQNEAEGEGAPMHL